MSILFWTYGVTGKFYLRLSLPLDHKQLLAEFAFHDVSVDLTLAMRLGFRHCPLPTFLFVGGTFFIYRIFREAFFLCFVFTIISACRVVSSTVSSSSCGNLHIRQRHFFTTCSFLLFLHSLSRSRCYYYIVLLLCLVLV